MTRHVSLHSLVNGLATRMSLERRHRLLATNGLRFPILIIIIPNLIKIWPNRQNQTKSKQLTANTFASNTFDIICRFCHQSRRLLWNWIIISYHEWRFDGITDSTLPINYFSLPLTQWKVLLAKFCWICHRLRQTSIAFTNSLLYIKSESFGIFSRNLLFVCQSS